MYLRIEKGIYYQKVIWHRSFILCYEEVGNNKHLEDEMGERLSVNGINMMWVDTIDI